MHIHTHTHTHTRTHTHAQALKHTHTHTHTRARTHARTHARARARSCARTHGYRRNDVRAVAITIMSCYCAVQRRNSQTTRTSCTRRSVSTHLSGVGGGGGAGGRGGAANVSHVKQEAVTSISHAPPRVIDRLATFVYCSGYGASAGQWRCIFNGS